VERPIGILYEHPLWFKPLFGELDRRGVAYEKLHAGELVFDPGDPESRYSLVVNRMSPSAWTRGQHGAIFHSVHFLAYLDEIGARVVNGHAAFQVEISKARQCALLARLGVRYPASRAVGDRRHLPAAAEGLRFPVLVKPNVGGSGAGIRSFATAADLREAAADKSLEFGLDGTALVQEHLPAADESIVRIEILGGEFLYAIRLRLLPGSFNLCPADYCELPGVADGVSGRGLPIERYDPPSELIEAAKRIVAAAGMELGGVEYLVSQRDGLAYFYDVNALSNFVANAPEVIGFDPFVDLVDFVVERAHAPGDRATAAETALRRTAGAAA
jgi:D-alanine-D-alanine ligase-like ATP-grasp enzyme